MTRYVWALVVAAWRRVMYCRTGHVFMFERSRAGIVLVCPRCLTSYLVFPSNRITPHA